jgi:hypothetical protein
MKALFAAVALLTAAAASAQTAPTPAQAAPTLAPPPGQATGSAPPTASGFRNEDPNEFWRGRRGTPVVIEREDMEQRLARLERLLGDAAERSGRGHGKGKLNEAYNELNGIRQVVSNAPDVRGYFPRPAPTPPPPPVPAYQPIADGRLQKLMNAMAREPFGQDKMNVLEDGAEGNYFLVGQVQQVLGQFQFSKDRLQVVRMLWPRVLDRQNGFQLYNAFQFSNDKEELKRIISG